MYLTPTRREVLVGAAAAVTVPLLPDAPPPMMRSRLPPKLEQALDELSKQPSTLSPELEAYLERTEGWMDHLGGAK
jgi:hypothetical protein